MVVLTVVAAAFSEVCLCLVKGHLINERFVRVGRYGPIFLRNGNLFAGLNACLAGFPKQRIAKINLHNGSGVPGRTARHSSWPPAYHAPDGKGLWL